MSSKPVKFLSEADLSNLELYEYHGGDYSYLDNFLNPFWIKVAYAFPAWFAPNLITLTGLIINIVAATLVGYYDPMLIGEAPAWVYINAAICLQIYGTLDAADGKQARRISASSPLGQIFDHGCDAVNLIFIIISSCSGLGLGIGKTTSAIIILMSITFVVAQLYEYQTNILLVGSKVFGVTETMLIISVSFIITAIFGAEVWNYDLAKTIPQLSYFGEICPLKYVACVLLIIAVITTATIYVVKGLITPSPILMEKRGNKNLSHFSYVIRIIPTLIISICSYILLNSEIMNQYSLYIIFLCGLTYSFLAIRINVSHLCRRKLSYRFSGMYPLLIATINEQFHVFPNSTVIPLCFLLFMVMYTSFVFATINQIKERLHIRAFHVMAKKE